MKALSNILTTFAAVLLTLKFEGLCSPDPGPNPVASPGQNRALAPVITRQPIDTIVKRQSTARFECQAEGFPVPNISWLKDGKPLILGQGIHAILGQELMIYRASRSKDQGTYQCIATNSLGTAKSRNATLKIAYINEEFRKRPNDDVVSVGSTVKLECQGPRGSPTPSIYWKKNNERLIPDGERIRIEKGDLIISSATKDDAASYSCVASNMAGSKESLNVILSVHVSPQFTVVPKDQTVMVGDDVVLTCQASGDPSPRISWDKVRGSLSRRVTLLSNNNLQISGVQPEDAGEYQCSAKNVLTTLQSTAVITVNEKPSFTTPPRDVTTRVGDTVSIPCVAEGSPKPSIIWHQKDGPSMFSGGRYKDDHISIKANGELIIYNVQYSDQGKYICEAISSNRPVARAEAQVAVLSRESNINPPVITRGPTNMTIEQGGNIEFKCTSSAVPVPDFTWSKDGSGDMKTGGRFTVTNSGVLRIAAVQSGDAGQYKCTATNEYGWSQWKFWIKVASHGSPSITSEVNSRDLPTAPSTPTFVNSTSSTITIRWSPIQSTAVVGYILEYYCLQGISTWTRASSELIRPTIYTVTNLKDSSDCVFFVRSQNKYGVSDPSDISETFSTKASTRPTSPDDKLQEKLSQISIHVKNVQTSTSSGSTVVSWEPPVSCDVIDGYRIYVQAVSHEKQSPIVETADCFGNSKELSLTERVYYEIRVRPYKDSVEGKFSPIVLAYPPSGEVELDDLVLSAHAKSSKDESASVQFSWEPPSHILPQYITHYTLRCYDKSYAKDAYDVTKRLNSTQISLNLKGLPADRSYSAYVMFSTAFGKGMQSEVVDFETPGEQSGAVNSIFKNPAILAAIAGCVLIIIVIIVSVLLYRKYKKNKKSRGLHARSIQIDGFSGAQYTKGFTMSIANSGGNNNYSDGTGSSSGHTNSGKMFMPGMSNPSPATRNTTVSMNNSNGNVGTSISPNMGDMRTAQRHPGTFSYVTDQLTNMSNIHPQFSSPNVERNQTSLADIQQYHRRISESATALPDEFVPHGDLIDMTTPTSDDRYMTRDNDLPPPPPSPPMSQKTSLSDRTNRSRGSSRASADHGSNHSSKGRRSKERNRVFQPLDRAPTDTDTGIDSPQQTPSPPRPADLRGDHHLTSLPLKTTRTPHYSQSTSRIRNEGFPAEYSRSVGPNHGYYGGHETESDYDGNRRTNFIPLPEDVRNSVTASSVSMMNRYDSDSNCSERSPSPASSDDSLNMESVSQVGLNPKAISPASSAFVPVPGPFPNGDSIAKQRRAYQKPKVPIKQYTSGHYEGIHTQPTKLPTQEHFLNRVNSASSTSSSSFHQNTADSGMSAGVGSYGHNSLNSNSSSESGPKSLTNQSRTSGSLATETPNTTINQSQYVNTDRRYMTPNDDENHFHNSRTRPVLPPKKIPKMGMAGRSPQRIHSKDSSLPLPSNGSAYINYDEEADNDVNEMLPSDEYCVNEDDVDTEESRTAFLAAKSVFSSNPQKNLRGRFPELSDVPEVSTSDFCEDYSDRSQ